MADEDVLSAHSSSITEDHLNDLTDEQLTTQLQDLLRKNEVLEAETKMFEKYLKRIDPHFVPGALLPMQSLFAPQQGGLANLDLSSRGPRRRSKSKSSSSTTTMRLNAEQKCDIAQREIEELREEGDKAQIESDKILDGFRANMEESEQRNQEAQKSLHNLEKMVFPPQRQGAMTKMDPALQKLPAERVLRFFEEMQKDNETQIEKLRLKNSTLKQQFKKLELQLKQKEEMGEVLHEVDFQQLKIENTQYLEKIEEKNQELLKLKVMAGKTQQVLNTHKKRLSSQQQENERLQFEIGLRDEMLKRLESEKESAEVDKTKAEEVNTKLKDQLSNFRVPDVMVYVREKAELDRVHVKNRIWQRKVDIAQMGLQTKRKTWHKMHAFAAVGGGVAPSHSLPSLGTPPPSGWK